VDVIAARTWPRRWKALEDLHRHIQILVSLFPRAGRALGMRRVRAATPTRAAQSSKWEREMKLISWPCTAILVVLAGCVAREAPPPGAVVIAVTENGFEPAVASVPRGKPVTLIVTRRTDRTCATEMVFETSGQRHELPLGKPVRVELAAGVSDTLRYACGMDMIRGMIVAR
jgi:hypothetical protein